MAAVIVLSGDVVGLNSTLIGCRGAMPPEKFDIFKLYSRRFRRAASDAPDAPDASTLQTLQKSAMSDHVTCIETGVFNCL